MGAHVGVFPFPFTSHPYSMLALVRKLAQAAPNVQFSFFSTSNSNDSLFGSKVELEHNIKAYDVEDGVPVGHVFSSDPREPMNLFLKANPKSFKRAMDMAVAETSLNVSCLIFDVFLCDLLKDFADDLSVPLIVFFPLSPFALSIYLYLELIRKHMDEARTNDGKCHIDFLPGFSQLQISDIDKIIPPVHAEDQPLAQAILRMGDLLPRATAVVLNCYREIKPSLLISDLQSKFQKFLMVGFFARPLQLPPSDSDKTGCLSWLDGQKARSVVYISCGTIDVALLESEIIALVHERKFHEAFARWVPGEDKIAGESSAMGASKLTSFT